jgi:hypothetical protein
MKQTLDTTLLASTSMNTSFFSPPIEVAPYSAGTIQVLLNYPGGSTNIGNFAIQVSLDNTNWSLILSSVQYADSSHGNLSMLIEKIYFKYIRVRYQNASGTGASAAILAHLVV